MFLMQFKINLFTFDLYDKIQLLLKCITNCILNTNE